MKNHLKLIPFLFLCQFAMAQVDVTYSDLVWSDEFDTNGAINASKWHHQTQLPSGGGWFNGEQQHYTNQLTNSFVNAGFLNIVAKKESFTDQNVTKQYTSARLNSKFAFKYGRVDVRAKLPIGAGTWPAIWLLGKNVNELGGFFQATHGTMNWPACGEIDVMEHGIYPSQPINFIGSAVHTTSSSGNTINKDGTLVKNLGTDFHVYSLNWSPNQLTFLVDNVAFYTYNPADKDAKTWPFDAEQYVLLNVAMGGIAGKIPSDFTQAGMEVDYVRVYQDTTPDIKAPTNFTASIGETTGSTIELLLKGSDNVSNIFYDVKYGNQNVTVTGLSGVQKSYIITGLSSNTSYSFNITAKDASNNQAANNPIVLNAKTITESNLICSGTSKLAQQGAFLVGYNYEYKTEGNNVKITYTLLDTDKTDVFAYLWKQIPFGETDMKKTTGKTFTHTLTGQTVGSSINYAVKFAFAGGLSATQYYAYEVGSSCSTSIEEAMVEKDIYFNNPAKNFINITSKNKIDKVELYDLSGDLVLASSVNTSKIDVQALQTGLYTIIFYLEKEKVAMKVMVEN